MTTDNKYARTSIRIEKSLLHLATKYNVNVNNAAKEGIISEIKRIKTFYKEMEQDNIDLEIERELQEAEEKWD